MPVLRFLIFAIKWDEPRGGWDDFKACGPTAVEAQDAWRDFQDTSTALCYEYAELIDIEQLRPIADWSPQTGWENVD